MQELEKMIFEATGCEFNLSDREQVADVMGNRLGISTDAAFFEWLHKTNLETARNLEENRRLLDTLRWYC